MQNTPLPETIYIIGSAETETIKLVQQKLEEAGIPHRHLPMEEASGVLADGSGQAGLIIIPEQVMSPELMQEVLYTAMRRRIHPTLIGRDGAKEAWERLVPLELPEFLELKIHPADGDWVARFLPDETAPSHARATGTVINNEQRMQPIPTDTPEPRKAKTPPPTPSKMPNKEKLPLYALATCSISSLIIATTALFSSAAPSTPGDEKIAQGSLRTEIIMQAEAAIKAANQAESAAKQASEDISKLLQETEQWKRQTADVAESAKSIAGEAKTRMDVVEAKLKSLDAAIQDLSSDLEQLQPDNGQDDGGSEATDSQDPPAEAGTPDEQIAAPTCQPPVHKCPPPNGARPGGKTYKKIQEGADLGCPTCKANLRRIKEAHEANSQEGNHKCPSPNGARLGGTTYKKIQDGAAHGCPTCKANLQRLKELSHLKSDNGQSDSGDNAADNTPQPTEEGTPSEQETDPEAKEEADSKDKEDAERKAREEAVRIVREREEAERKAREEAERKAKEAEVERIRREHDQFRNHDCAPTPDGKQLSNHTCPSPNGVRPGSATYKKIQEGAALGCPTCKANLQRLQQK